MLLLQKVILYTIDCSNLIDNLNPFSSSLKISTLFATEPTFSMHYLMKKLTSVYKKCRCFSETRQTFL